MVLVLVRVTCSTKFNGALYPIRRPVVWWAMARSARTLGTTAAALRLRRISASRWDAPINPVRQHFVDALLGEGGMSLGLFCRSEQIWDFGQHSVHENWQRCLAILKVIRWIRICHA